MEYKSSPSGRTADLYSLGLFVGGAFFFLYANYVPKFTAVCQLVSVILIGAALYLVIRYRLTPLRFRIEGRNGAPVDDIFTSDPIELDFTVDRIKGKKIIPQARLSLGELRSAERVPYDSLKEKCAGMALYRYHADMSPADGVLLVFDGEERQIAIFCELPANMVKFLADTAFRSGQAQ